VAPFLLSIWEVIGLSDWTLQGYALQGSLGSYGAPITHRADTTSFPRGRIHDKQGISVPYSRPGSRVAAALSDRTDNYLNLRERHCESGNSPFYDIIVERGKTQYNALRIGSTHNEPIKCPSFRSHGTLLLILLASTTFRFEENPRHTNLL